MTQTSATIIVIDDDASVRKALTRLLRSVHLEARSFASAEDFLGEILPPPACLILDIHLPGGVGGFELHRRLSEKGSKVPIIFVTGHFDEDVVQTANELGAIAVFQKPFDDQALLEAVARACGQHSKV